MLSAKEFYEQNKDYKNITKPLPNLCMSNEDITRWVLAGNAGDYIELDSFFRVPAWQEESKLAESYYVGHRDIEYGEGTHNGWNSCALHGIATNKTSIWQVYGYEERPTYDWTELGQQCENIKTYLKNFVFEELDRVRFMKLDPGGWVSPHNDQGPGIDYDNIFDYTLPINIAIDHPEDCYMTVEDSGIVPFKSGKMFIVNIAKNHSVINFSNRPRIHLIAHGYVGNRKHEYCNLVANSYRKQYVLQSKI